MIRSYPLWPYARLTLAALAVLSSAKPARALDKTVLEGGFSCATAYYNTPYVLEYTFFINNGRISNFGKPTGTMTANFDAAQTNQSGEITLINGKNEKLVLQYIVYQANSDIYGRWYGDFTVIGARSTGRFFNATGGGHIIRGRGPHNGTELYEGVMYLQ